MQSRKYLLELQPEAARRLGNKLVDAWISCEEPLFCSG
jgi:hypothetical protein